MGGYATGALGIFAAVTLIPFRFIRTRLEAPREQWEQPFSLSSFFFHHDTCIHIIPVCLYVSLHEHFHTNRMSDTYVGGAKLFVLGQWP